VGNYILQNYKIRKYFLQNFLRKVFYKKHFAKKLAAISCKFFFITKFISISYKKTFKTNWQDDMMRVVFVDVRDATARVLVPTQEVKTVGRPLEILSFGQLD